MALPQTYDLTLRLLLVTTGGIPIAYVRALISRESDFNPSATSGTATGLLQVGPENVADFNDRHAKAAAAKGEAWSNLELADMKNASKGLWVGVEALYNVVMGLKRHPTLQPDWHSRDYVEVLTLAWNAGYSDAAGVGLVASYLEARGIPVTLDNIMATKGKVPGAVSTVYSPAKHAWCRGVAALYFVEAGITPSAAVASSQAPATPAAARAPADAYATPAAPPLALAGAGAPSRPSGARGAIQALGLGAMLYDLLRR